jgi:hypothetical protein
MFPAAGAIATITTVGYGDVAFTKPGKKNMNFKIHNPKPLSPKP